METKEWNLREEDIILPPEEKTPPPPLRYAIVVEIQSVEQPWPFETAPPPSTQEEENAIKDDQNISKDGKLPSSSQGKGSASEKVPKNESKGKKKNNGKQASEEVAAVNHALPALASGTDAVNTSPKEVPRSKASFSYKFPGAPSPLEKGDIEIGEAIAPNIPPLPMGPSEPTEGDTDLDEPEGEDDTEGEDDGPPPPPPTTRFVNIPTKEFDVISNYSLWHTLLSEPLVITLYWTSPSGTTRLPFAQVQVDLFPVLALKEGKLENFYKLEKVPEPPAPPVEEKPSKTRKGGKSAAAKEEEKGKKGTKKKKGEKEAPPPSKDETPPPLLDGAHLKLALSSTNPLWCEDDNLHGVVVEYDLGIIRNLPPKVLDYGLKSKQPLANKGDNANNNAAASATEDPFQYTLALELPGFFGLPWWDDIGYMSQEEKASIAQVRFEGGRVEMEDVPVPQKKQSIIPPQGSIEEAMRLYRKAREETERREATNRQTVLAEEAKSRLEKMEHDHLVKQLLESEESFDPKSATSIDGSPEAKALLLRAHGGSDIVSDSEPQAVVKWPSRPVVRRFLPGQAVVELKKSVKLGRQFRGEVARVAKTLSSLQDASFDKYHGCFFVNLSPFLEEGCLSFDLVVPFQRYSLDGTRAGVPLIQLPTTAAAATTTAAKTAQTDKPTSPKGGGSKPTSPKSGAKKQQAPKGTPVVVVDDDPPLPVCTDPNNPLPNNAWQLSNACLGMKLQADRPLEPFWKAPPEPDVSLDEVIPPRPKFASVHDAVQMALDKFAEFVEYVGGDLLDMHQDLTGQDNFHEERSGQNGADSLSRKRFEKKGEVRKKIVHQLQKQGLWNDIREEMKTKVLKVAAEKYRERKRAADDIGKFEFCNNLYISLSEVAFNTLKKLLEKRRNKKSIVIDNLTRLREYADEYEAEEDYQSANRCHQERLLGDNLYNPDIWFEYGCFCMRTRPKDQGKAEECWREALTLKKNHLYSLQALGCLMWHRGFLTQALVLLRNAVDLYCEEEHINWVLLSQVYAEQGERDHSRSCIKRAETLYFAWRDSRHAYSPPHQLLSRLWKFPFSVSHLALTAYAAQNRDGPICTTSGLYVDSAMLLLDLHLPKEAEILLGLEVEIYACTLDNKWCRARIAELNGNLEQARSCLADATKLEKENPPTWLLKGRLLYNYDPPPQYPPLLRINLYKNAIEAFNQYQRYLREGDEHYKFAYLELGYSHAKLGGWDEARKVFLKGCTVVSASPALWLAAGIAYYHCGDLNHSELALVEGNVLDPANFKMWAYLTLICIGMERHEEAEVSLQQGLKCTGLDMALLVTIAQNFAKLGNFRDAEIAYLEALKIKEVAHVRFELAEMYFSEGKFLFARSSYEMVVKAKDVSIEDKSVSISRLTEMQEDDGSEPPINRHMKNLPVEI